MEYAEGGPVSGLPVEVKLTPEEELSSDPMVRAYQLSHGEMVVTSCCRTWFFAWDLYGSGEPHRCPEPCESCGVLIAVVHYNGRCWREVRTAGDGLPPLATLTRQHTPERCRDWRYYLEFHPSVGATQPLQLERWMRR